MSFFLKSKPRTDIVSSSSVAAQPQKAVLSLVRGEDSPKASPQGLAIAQRLSGKQVVVPRGFRISATHISLQGQALIEGSLVGTVNSYESVEVLAGGHLAGVFTGNELTVSGHLQGTAHFNSLHLKSGSLCEGSIEGRSVAIDEGARLEASCRFTA